MHNISHLRPLSLSFSFSLLPRILLVIKVRSLFFAPSRPPLMTGSIVTAQGAKGKFIGREGISQTDHDITSFDRYLNNQMCP
jgi:hypothetical protein